MNTHLGKAKAALAAVKEKELTGRETAVILEIARTQALVSIAESLSKMVHHP